MLGRIVVHEWRRLRSDRASRFSLAAVALVFAAASAASASRARTAIEQAQRADKNTAESRDELRRAATEISTGARAAGRIEDPRSPSKVANGELKLRATLPPLPLCALSAGPSDLLPQSLEVKSRSRHTASDLDEPENPASLLAGRFDLSFLVTCLLPLVVLALSFDLISGEKEAGTWALLRSQPVRLGWILLGKIIPRMAILLALVLVFSLFAVAASGADLSSGGLWTSYSLWFSGVALYAGFWFSLALLVNAFGRSSAANALVLSAAWLLIVMVAPALIQAWASQRAPPPARLEQVLAMRDLSLRLGASSAKLAEAYYAARPETKPAAGAPQLGDFRIRLFPVWSAFDRYLRPLLVEEEKRRSSQNELVRKLSLFSPPLAVEHLSGDVAGTGYDRWAAFMPQVDACQQEWRDFFGPKIMSGVHLNVDDYDRAPRFRYEAEPVAERSTRILKSLLGLGAAAGISLVLAGLAIARWTR